MDRADLLQRANHYRELAARVPDEQIREGLLDVARGFEALAEQAGKRASNHPDDPDARRSR
jgi:hypothetical protein